ncbi:hypothetical protein V8E55_006573 [Tylopilus felleus]
MEIFLGQVGAVMGAFWRSVLLWDARNGSRRRHPSRSGPFPHTWNMLGSRPLEGVPVGSLVGCGCCLVLLGQLVVDTWARRGLLGSEFCPEAYRPSTLFLNWLSRKNGAP